MNNEEYCANINHKINHKSLIINYTLLFKLVISINSSLIDFT